MIKCSACKDRMIEALYGELGPAEREVFDEHLRACRDCASEYSLLGATLRVMDRRHRPDPGREFWDGYWDKLEARLAADRPGVGDRISSRLRLGGFLAAIPRWAYQAAAAAALVAAGFIVGHNLQTPRTPGPSRPLELSSAAAIPASNLTDPAARAENYLERSKVLLLGLVNYDPKTQDAYALDFSRTKERSRELAGQAVNIQSSLTDPRQQRLRDLVADLQVILLQIANLGVGQDLEGVELVKQGVDQKGIFLRIDLTRMARTAKAAKGTESPERSAGRKDKVKA